MSEYLVKWIDIILQSAQSSNKFESFIRENCIEYFELEGNFTTIKKQKNINEKEVDLPENDNIFLGEDIEEQKDKEIVENKGYNFQIFKPNEKCDKKLAEMLAQQIEVVKGVENYEGERITVPKEAPEGSRIDESHWIPEELCEYFQSCFIDLEVKEPKIKLPSIFDSFKNNFKTQLVSYNELLSYEKKIGDNFYINAKLSTEQFRENFQNLKKVKEFSLQLCPINFDINLFGQRHIILRSQLESISFLNVKYFDLLDFHALSSKLLCSDQNLNLENSIFLSISLIIFSQISYEKIKDFYLENSRNESQELLSMIQNIPEIIEQPISVYQQNLENEIKVVASFNNKTDENNNITSCMWKKKN